MAAIKLSHASILTSCSGSWDGPGQTGCELQGRPGETGFFFDLSQFVYEDTVYSNTGRHDSIEFYPESNGSLTFRNYYSEYNSLLHPFQFAYWKTHDGAIVVGIEDLDRSESIGSDYDYNDLMVRFTPATPVPETGSFVLLLLGIVCLVLFRQRSLSNEQ